LTGAITHPSSFRDPSGRVFVAGGTLLRGVFDSGRPDYDHLINSGLYDKLVGRGLLIPHEDVSSDGAIASSAAAAYSRVIKPERIAFISYASEWSFSQLKDAALTVLDAQTEALSHGMILKDAPTANVQFRGGRPILIDTLSFVRAQSASWPAYFQFCKHFVAPLLLASYGVDRALRWSAVEADGIPLEVAARLLPRRSWLRPLALWHLHLHARANARPGNARQDSVHAGNAHPGNARHGDFPAGNARPGSARQDSVHAGSAHPAGTLPGNAHQSDARSGNGVASDHARGHASQTEPRAYLAAIGRQRLVIESLRSGIDGLSWSAPTTQWSRYEDERPTYSPEAWDARFGVVRRLLGQLKPAVVWDFGMAAGHFSREASAAGSLTVGFEADASCVERAYLGARERGDTRLLPLVQDLLRPTSPGGWAETETLGLSARGPADLLLVLGLAHHLAVPGGVPLGHQLAHFTRLGRKVLFELVPATDPIALGWASRFDVRGLDRAAFESTVLPLFNVIETVPLPASERVLYLVEAR